MQWSVRNSDTNTRSSIVFRQAPDEVFDAYYTVYLGDETIGQVTKSDGEWCCMSWAKKVKGPRTVGGFASRRRATEYMLVIGGHYGTREHDPLPGV